MKALFLLGCLAAPALASDPRAAAVAEATARLRLSRGGPADLVRAALRERRLLMEELIAADPRAALAAAMDDAERRSWPAGLRGEIERQVDLDGRLEVIIADDFARRDSRVLHRLVAAGRRYSLHFAGAAPLARSGAAVRVRGLGLGDRLAVPE